MSVKNVCVELKNNKPDEQVFMQTVMWSKAPDARLVAPNQGLSQLEFIHHQTITIRSKITFRRGTQAQQLSSSDRCPEQRSDLFQDAVQSSSFTSCDSFSNT